MHDQNEIVTILPNIYVQSLYCDGMRERIRIRLDAIRDHYKIGMIRFHAEIVETVAINNSRIFKPNGKCGLYLGQLSVKNLYHFCEGVRSHDTRVQILDAYLKIANEAQDTV